MTETCAQRDARELAEAHVITTQLNTMGLIAGDSAIEKWHTGLKDGILPCVQIQTFRGLQHAQEMRQTLLDKKIVADKKDAVLYVVGGGIKNSHLIQMCIFSVNWQMLEAVPSPPTPRAP